MSAVMISILGIASIASADANVGDYTSTQCTDAYFVSNQCDQCFSGGTLKTTQKVSNLYDQWSNTTTGSILLYKSDQQYPSVVNLGGSGTTISSNPVDPSVFWQFGGDIIWTDSFSHTGDKEFEISSGKKIKIHNSDVGSYYSLDSTTVQSGSPVMLVKFPLTYVGLTADGTETAKKTHTECVVYSYGQAAPAPAPAPAPVVVVPASVPPPAPEPAKMTETKTGPETDILLFVAFALTGVILYARRRRA